MIMLDISNGMKTIIMIVAMILVFYFFLIRPQNQETKKQAAYRDSLKSGDRLMTAGGIHVTYIENDKYTPAKAIVEIAPGTRITIAKAALQPIPERKAKK